MHACNLIVVVDVPNEMKRIPLPLYIEDVGFRKPQLPLIVRISQQLRRIRS